MASKTQQISVNPLRVTRRMPVSMSRGRIALLLLLILGLVTFGVASVGAQRPGAASSVSAPTSIVSPYDDAFFRITSGHTQTRPSVAAPTLDVPVGHEHYLQLWGWPARDGRAYGHHGSADEIERGEIGRDLVVPAAAPTKVVPATDASTSHGHYPQLSGWLAGTVWESVARE